MAGVFAVVGAAVGWLASMVGGWAWMISAGWRSRGWSGEGGRKMCIAVSEVDGQTSGSVNAGLLRKRDGALCTCGPWAMLGMQWWHVQTEHIRVMR